MYNIIALWGRDYTETKTTAMDGGGEKPETSNTARSGVEDEAYK